MSYHTTVKQVYAKAAESPDRSLCCTTRSPLYLPGLDVPPIMYEMNYGCGSTVHLADMRRDQSVLYVGVGGGLEALQFAYFARRPGGVVAIDPVAEMREAARRNLELAAGLNDWFDPSFVEIRDGDALALPVESQSIDLAAQNCLFNIFKTAGANGTGGDLERALGEMHRVLRPTGRLSMTDPITPRPLPEHLQADETLRAQCISGCLTMDAYLDVIVDAGFGMIEVRSRRVFQLIVATPALEDAFGRSNANGRVDERAATERDRLHRGHYRSRGRAETPFAHSSSHRDAAVELEVGGSEGRPLLEQHHSDARLRELLGDDGAAGPRAHDRDVGLLGEVPVVFREDAEIDRVAGQLRCGAHSVSSAKAGCSGPSRARGTPTSTGAFTSAGV